MSNQKRLEEYLVGNEKSYLKSDISNGKVIMLSGKWGSGKTHFWQKKIQTILNEKDKKIPNHYISLYGKTSIDEIRNEVFLKIFESVDSSKLEEKGTKLAKNTIDLIVSFIKSIDIDGVKIDLSTISDNSFRQLEKFLKNKKIKKTVEYLNKSAIICFDDFERKSKDIDLNDLFGFITQLTLNFSCKVVIILNDDVFEGEEKKVFSNVKEKSVSKFLKYEPKIEELFNLIFDLEIEKDIKKEKKYKDLEPYKQIILKTIQETQELNARIYIQVLDNLVEWIEKNQETDENILRCLILVNINFVLYHKIVTSSINKERFIGSSDYDNKLRYCIKGLEEESKFTNLFRDIMEINCSKISIIKNLIDDKSQVRKEVYNQIDIDNSVKFINENHSNIYAINFATTHKFDNNIHQKELNKINNFIETGILINE